MYLVTNITNEKIFIKDLNVEIKSRQMLDLDNMNTAIKASESKELKSYLRSGKIKIMKVDSVEIEDNKKNIPEKEDNSKDISSLKDFFKKEIKKEISELKSMNHSGISEALEEIKKILENKNIQSNNNSPSIDKDEKLDENILADIQKSGINKIIQKSNSDNIEIQKKIIKDDSTIKNANELENLL